MICGGVAGSIAQDARQQATAQMEEASERRKESERKLQETLSVLKENVADTSGEALLSSASSYVSPNFSKCLADPILDADCNPK